MSKIITLKSHKCKSIMGKIIVPGDKSISHRALIFSAISIGRSEINGLLESDDVIKTLKALRNLGIKIVKTSEKYFVDGNGGVFTKYPSKLFFWKLWYRSKANDWSFSNKKYGFDNYRR